MEADLDYNVPNFIQTKKYKIYIDGKIWSNTHHRFLKTNYHVRKQYYMICDHDNGGKTMLLNRFIYQHFYGVELDSFDVIKYVDNNKKNCAITNLELISKRDSNFNHNRFIKKRNGSKSIGVSLQASSGKYTARYRNLEHKIVEIGRYYTFEAAQKAYNDIAEALNQVLDYPRYPLNDV